VRKVILEVDNNSDITQPLQKEIYKDSRTILIPKGNYTISSTIRIANDTHISGSPDLSTKLSLADATNCNMFTNTDTSKGNHNIIFENLWLEGNSPNQFRPENEKQLSFCDLFYFMKSSKIKFSNIKATNCKQTAMHFTNCQGITIDKLQANGMGWSGISTSGTDDIKASDVYIYDSGKDIMHSAVHYDGGIGSYFSGVIEKCTGNGVMLDSKFSVFNKSIVQAKCTGCKRGVSLLGDYQNRLSNVLIQNTETLDCEVGIMVSNSKHVFITGCNIQKSSQHGILLQGKNGGCETVIFDTEFNRNKLNITEIHGSNNNYFIRNNMDIQSKHSLNKPIDQKNIKKIIDRYTGFCSVCGDRSDFIYYGKSVRESYRCQNCKASLRHRGLAKAILDIYGNAGVKSIKELSQQDAFRNLTIFEPGIIGPLRKYFDHFPNYFQSYFWDDLPLGETRDGVQNQNLECLTFGTNSIDLLITADIFEHIRKPWKAYKDIHRVLKPSGKHIFTVPVQYPLPKKTVYRVDTSTNEDLYILAERYHIAGDGGKSLVYTDFGGDILEKLNNMGLKTEYVCIDEKNDLRKKNITFISTKLES